MAIVLVAVFYFLASRRGEDEGESTGTRRQPGAAVVSPRLWEVLCTTLNTLGDRRGGADGPGGGETDE